VEILCALSALRANNAGTEAIEKGFDSNRKGVRKLEGNEF